MRLLGACLFIIILSATAAFADIYYWTDKNGETHLADSLEKVPQEYRGVVKIRKTHASDSGAVEAVPEKAAPEAAQEVELYGEHPLDWWKEQFKKFRADINNLTASIMAKKEFIRFFEAGLRHGQIFEKKDADTYDGYKSALTEDEAKSVTLLAEQEELRRKARILGVPKTLWAE